MKPGDRVLIKGRTSIYELASVDNSINKALLATPHGLQWWDQDELEKVDG